MPDFTNPVRYRGYHLEHFGGKWYVSYWPLGFATERILWTRKYKRLVVAQRAINRKLDKGKAK
jgi:hypothetical protein